MPSDTPRRPASLAEAEIVQQLLKGTLLVYKEHGERAALRCALGDAAHLCDAIARQIEAANPGRKRGSVSGPGVELAAVAKRCGDTIWAMRDKIVTEGPHV